MDVEAIKTFLHLVETRNFSRTAETFFITQTAVSARIKSLEGELGKPLFERNSKGVWLTPAGKQFTEYAQKACEMLDLGLQAARNTDKFEQFIALGAPDSIWDSMLLEQVNRYMLANKGVSFTLVADHSEMLMSEVLSRKLDAAVTMIKPNSTVMSTLPYIKSRYCLVASTSLTIPFKKFGPAQLDLLPVIYMEWDSSFNRWFNTNYSTGPFSIELRSVPLFIQLLLSGCGIGFLPDRTAQHYIDRGLLTSIDYMYSESAPINSTRFVFLKANASKIEHVLYSLTAM